MSSIAMALPYTATPNDIEHFEQALRLIDAMWDAEDAGDLDRAAELKAELEALPC